MATIIETTTAEDLLRMPKDGFRYELMRGEIRKMSPAGNRHGKLTMRLSAPLFQYVEANGLGVVYAAETGFRLSTDPDTVLAPDIAFVSRKRIEAVGEPDGYWPGAPDLTVEVISPTDLYTEVEEKVFEWLNAGTAMVVLVNPRNRTVTTYRSRADIAVLTEGDTLDGADIVPGWTMPIGGLFL